VNLVSWTSASKEEAVAKTRRTKAVRKAAPPRAAAAPDFVLTTPVVPPGPGVPTPAETTGRFIVIFKEGASAAREIRATLNQVAGLRDVPVSSDYEDSAVTAKDLTSGPAVCFEKLGVAVVNSEEAVQALAASASDADSPILAIEPEYVAYPTSSGIASLEYMEGYRDGVADTYERLKGRGAIGAAEAVAAAVGVFEDTDQLTWGLQATAVHTSRFTGQGIKVAILDTGIDLTHPDFRGRAITTATFTGVPVQDVHGHGTHCAGTACGSQRPATGVRRYGVASSAQIFAGRVFDNSQPRPKAPTGAVIAGIEWAAANGCRVVSLSLGIPINQKIQQFERPIQRALAAGTLVVAAAGNNAMRPGNPGFVEPPANADAAMAVAAIDRRLQIASFSARSSQLTGQGGIVNVAAPGVAVFSSFPVTLGSHALLDGTSMATPHVAGIAALWAQSTAESGAALWSRVLQSVRPLPLLSIDVGNGLSQAPQ
jgi:subtilisin